MSHRCSTNVPFDGLILKGVILNGSQNTLDRFHEVDRDPQVPVLVSFDCLGKLPFGLRPENESAHYLR